MDKTKLKVLRDIKYRIPTTCNFCKHGYFEPKTDFGDCADKGYVHEKHTGTHFLSISRYGTCPDFVLDEDRTVSLHGFREFLK